MGKLIFLLLVSLGGFYAYEHYFGEKAPPPRLAPEGTVYNLVRTNAAESGRLIGVPPGTQLRLVKKASGSAIVEYRGLRFTMPDTMLTRDLDAVDQIRQGEARRLAEARKKSPEGAPAPPEIDPEVEKMRRSLVDIMDKRADLELQLAQINLRRHEKGDFDGLTDLRVVAGEISSRIQQLDLDAQRLRQLVERKTR